MRTRNDNFLVIKQSDLFFIAYGVYLVITILATSMFYQYIIGTKINILLFVCVLFLLAKEIMTMNSKRYFLYEIIFSCIFIIVVLIGNITLGYNSPLYLIIFIVAARNVDFDKIARFTIVITSIVVLFIMGSALIGIIPNYIIMAQKGVVTYLGFRYSLYPAAFCSNITMLYLYVNRDKLKWKNIFILLIINYVIYKLTISRLMFTLCIILLMISAIYKVMRGFPKKTKYLFRFSTMIYPIVMALSYGICKYYDPNISWMYKIDKALEGRIKLQYDVLKKYPVKLLGQNIIWSGNAMNVEGTRSSHSYFYADNLFLNMFLMYGVIFTVLIVAFLTITMLKLYKQKQFFLLMILVLLGLHGVVDDLIQYLYYDTFLLLIGCRILGNKNLVRRIKRQFNQNTRL